MQDTHLPTLAFFFFFLSLGIPLYLVFAVLQAVLRLACYYFLLSILHSLQYTLRSAYLLFAYGLYVADGHCYPYDFWSGSSASSSSHYRGTLQSGVASVAQYAHTNAYSVRCVVTRISTLLSVHCTLVLG